MVGIGASSERALSSSGYDRLLVPPTDGRGAVTATQLDIIPFHNTDLLATKINGKPYVVLKPAFEAMGIDADQQVRKIQKQSWACTAVTPVQVDDQRRNMIVADVRTFLMALATIPSTRVKPEVRDLLEAYQSEVADVIEAYYAKGMAPINPRVHEDQVSAVISEAVSGYRSAREQMIAEDKAERRALAEISAEQVSLVNLAMSTGLLDESWGKTKIQVIVSRGIGEVPEIPREDLPLYVEDFMKSKGVRQEEVSRFSSAFGRKIISWAKLEGVPVPGKRIQEMSDGTIREVTAWTRGHRPMFENAWQSSYANDLRVFPLPVRSVRDK